MGEVLVGLLWKFVKEVVFTTCACVTNFYNNNKKVSIIILMINSLYTLEMFFLNKNCTISTSNIFTFIYIRYMTGDAEIIHLVG